MCSSVMSSGGIFNTLLYCHARQRVRPEVAGPMTGSGGHPVIAAGSVNTGSSAFADDDNKGDCERRSRHHYHFADDLAVLNEAQAFARLFERQHLVDHRLDLGGADQLHQRGEIVVVKTVGADDLQLKTPDIAQVFLRIVTRGGTADQKLAAALEAAQRR